MQSASSDGTAAPVTASGRPRIGVIAAEGAAIAAIARSRPAASVPHYPAWTLRDLAEHTASILSWATTTVRTRARSRLPTGTLPAGTDAIDWLEACLDELVETLATTDAATPVWSFLAEHTVAAWERRMTIEIGIHRWDAQSAVGEPEPLLDLVATSGLDEFPELLLVDLGPLPTLEMHATDLDRRWTFGPGPATERVSATASELYLRLMARPGARLPRAWEAVIDAVPVASR